LKQVSSLRSGVAKNAILCLNELIARFQQNLDPEVEFIVPLLLKKIGEAKFLKEDS